MGNPEICDFISSCFNPNSRTTDLQEGLPLCSSDPHTMAEAIFPPNSVWCPREKLQLSTVQQPCFLGHVFLRTYFFLEDQSCNHPLCEPGVWLCPLATTGHFRTHCRKSSIQASVTGQGFCSSADSMGVLTSSTKLETGTCVQCLLTEEANPNNVQCTTGTRERSPARRGKGNKVKILEPGQGCELLGLADLGFSNRLWSLEYIWPRASPSLLAEWVLNEVLSISSSAKQ